jgi:hypothetical protein
MLHKDYDRKGPVAKKKKKKTLAVTLKGLGAQDELISGKPPVVKQFLFILLTSVTSFGGPLNSPAQRHGASSVLNQFRRVLILIWHRRNLCTNI